MDTNFAFQPKCQRIRIGLWVSWAVLLVWTHAASATSIKDVDIALAVDTQLENDDGVPVRIRYGPAVLQP